MKWSFSLGMPLIFFQSGLVEIRNGTIYFQLSVRNVSLKFIRRRFIMSAFRLLERFNWSQTWSPVFLPNGCSTSHGSQNIFLPLRVDPARSVCLCISIGFDEIYYNYELLRKIVNFVNTQLIFHSRVSRVRRSLRSAHSSLYTVFVFTIELWIRTIASRWTVIRLALIHGTVNWLVTYTLQPPSANR